MPQFYFSRTCQKPSSKSLCSLLIWVLCGWRQTNFRSHTFCSWLMWCDWIADYQSFDVALSMSFFFSDHPPRTIMNLEKWRTFADDFLKHRRINVSTKRNFTKYDFILWQRNVKACRRVCLRLSAVNDVANIF